MRLTFFSAAIVCLFSSGAANCQAWMVYETSGSEAQTAYLETLSAQLNERGVVVEGAPFAVERGGVREFLAEGQAKFGLVYLDGLISDGNEMAAILSTPGVFGASDDFRAAQQGPIGDVARDEIGDETLIALRLWTHSADSLISAETIKEVKDISGVKVVTGGRIDASFVSNLGGVPTRIASSEVYSALASGVASSAVVSQKFVTTNGWDLEEVGSIFPEHRQVTAATMVDRSWWVSQSARTQKIVLDALETAEMSADEAITLSANHVKQRALEAGVPTLQWSDFSQEEVRRAAAFAVSDTFRVEPGVFSRVFGNPETLDPGISPREERDNDGSRDEGLLRQSPRIFFATDRRYDSDEHRLEYRFANAIEGSEQSVVRCGELAPFEAGRLGDFYGPVVLAQGTRMGDGDECSNTIIKAVEEGNGRLIIFVHGFNNTFDVAVRKALAFERDTQIQSTLVIWSWPSNGGLGSYNYDVESVAQTRPNFLGFVESLYDSEAVEQVDFLAHSMGSRLLTWYMQDHWSGKTGAIVLSAADVSRPVLANAVKSAIGAAVTLHATEVDSALAISKIKNHRPRAGQVIPEIFVMEGLDTIDLSAFDGNFGNHNHSFKIAEVISDLAILFDGQWRAADRGLDDHRTGSGVYYRIYPRTE